MRKSRVVLIVAGILLMVLCVAVLVVQPTIIAGRRSRLLTVGLLNQQMSALMLLTAKRTYEELGIETDTLEALVYSPFFPFELSSRPLESSVQPCGGEKFYFRFERSDHEVSWKVGWKASGLEGESYVLILPQRSEAERTRVFLASLVRPAEEWHKQLEAFYKNLSQKRFLGHVLRSPEAMVVKRERYCGQSLRVKDLSGVQVRAVALGRLRGERYVSEYVRFLREVLGLELVDGWGRAVRLAWQGGELVASSAGGDGRWDSGDDLVVRGRVIGGVRE